MINWSTEYIYTYKRKKKLKQKSGFYKFKIIFMCVQYILKINNVIKKSLEFLIKKYIFKFYYNNLFGLGHLLKLNQTLCHRV